MILYSSILGIPIVLNKGNIRMAVVKDVLFSSKDNRILGLIVQEKGITGPAKYIPLEHIVEVNETFLVTDASDCIKCFKNTKDEYNDFGIFMNDFVYSKGGTFFGQIKDIICDFDKNSVEGFVVSKSYVEDIFSKREKLINIQNSIDLSKYTIVNYC